MSDGWTPLLAFESDKREWSLGFECGRVWALLNASDEAHDFEMHTESAEMYLRMASATGRTVRADFHDEVWATVWFGEREDGLAGDGQQ